MNKPNLITQRLLIRLRRVFFFWLYHPLAWAYDFVANTVSLGMWNDWIESVCPDLSGQQILELGHGPGHLQRKLAERGIQTYGLDESRQMGRMAARRLKNSGQAPRLCRGYAQRLPFPAHTFGQVVATFPSEYIFDPDTLSEAHRVLRPGGKMLVLPVAWITGRGWAERAAAWLFRVTGQAPDWDDRILARFRRAGFQTSTKPIERESWTVLIIILKKVHTQDA